MKAIGMYFIIAGHIFLNGYEYIYVFSVPLFFLISGYLGHREENAKVFWRKMFFNLILPCILIAFILHAEHILTQIRLHTFEWFSIPRHFFNCIIGNLGLESVEGGIGICWFIYTLVICKVIQQFLSRNRVTHIGVIVVCLTLAIWYNVSDLHLCNAWTNTTLAYPLYATGGGYKSVNLKRCNPKRWWLFLALFGSIITVYLIGRFNGAPWMYDATYGKNIILFFVGGIAGSSAVYIISYLFKDYKLSAIVTLSKGTIIILGFHQLLIRAFDRLPAAFHSLIAEYVAALFILLTFIPIIQLSEKYFPVLLGYRAGKHQL